MKKATFFKRSLAILTAGTIVLMSGCTDTSSKKEEKRGKLCQHLTIYFEDTPITFKECEGYDIHVSRYNGGINYYIDKDGKTILDGWNNNAHYYKINHEEFNIESKQKVKN